VPLSWPPDPHALILLTPEARRRIARSYAWPAAAFLVDFARARTLERFGDRAGANAILDRPIGRQAHAPSSD